MVDALPLVLCEYAAFHSDGTYTLVKGGITFWRANLPLELSLVAFIQVPRGTLPVGESPVAIEVRHMDGQVLKQITGLVAIPASDAAVDYLAVPVRATVQRYGLIRIVVRAGSSTWSGDLDVRPRESA